MPWKKPRKTQVPNSKNMDSGHPTGKTVIVLQGPTAVGKTALSLAVAQRLQTSIVSADSRQCYREMTIGTAKPTQDELGLVKHYFIDAYSVTDALTAADYETVALQALDEIFKDSHVAIVCGGTGLYIKALCEGLDPMPTTDPIIAAAIDEQYQTKGLDWLREQVQATDPVFFKNGENLNPSRLIRALAFTLTTGESILKYRSGNKKERPFRAIKIGLTLPREQLYQRINDRVKLMMAHGLLEEVQALYPLRHLKNLQTVGYSELFDYIDGKYSLEAAISKIQQHTRNYAKRQITWFQNTTDATWFNANDTDLADRIIEMIQ